MSKDLCGRTGSVVQVGGVLMLLSQSLWAMDLPPEEQQKTKPAGPPVSAEIRQCRVCRASQPQVREEGKTPKWLICSRCQERASPYCSSDCQRRDWPQHKERCREAFLKRFQERWKQALASISLRRIVAGLHGSEEERALAHQEEQEARRVAQQFFDELKKAPMNSESAIGLLIQTLNSFATDDLRNGTPYTETDHCGRFRRDVLDRVFRGVGDREAYWR